MPVDPLSPLLRPSPAQLNANYPAGIRPIDADVAVNPHFDAATLPNTVSGFRFWQVESLLNQAADLLDRGIRDRAEYDELNAKSLKLHLEIQEFDALEAIHQLEIAAGTYTLNRDQSIAEEAAQDTLAAKNRQARNTIDTALAAHYGNLPQRASDAGVLAKISAYATYQAHHAAAMAGQGPFLVEVNGIRTVMADVGYGHLDETLVAADGTAGAHTQPGGVKKSDKVRDLTTDQTLHSLNTEKANLEAQSTAYSAATDAAVQLAIARHVKTLWDTADADFRRSRADVACLSMN